MDCKFMLKNQVAIVIEYLEEKYHPGEEGGVIKLIYDRYCKAYKILNNEVTNLADLHLAGGVRAYMDSYSDYENPLLEEMYKAEKLLKQIEMEK